MTVCGRIAILCVQHSNISRNIATAQIATITEVVLRIKDWHKYLNGQLGGFRSLIKSHNQCAN